MDQRALIDVICRNALKNLSGEIGALLGQDLTCSDIQLDITTKAHLFSNPERDKTALTRMTISGEREGDSYLLTRISTAAIVAGTLIMLPEDMIEENASSGQLDGELSDAFGEVANIIAGVFTQAFVDKYPKTLRFIKQTVEELVPTKVEIAGDAPFPPGNYYVASCKMALGDKDLGPLELVVPAVAFELEEEEVETSEDLSAQEPAATEQAEAASAEATGSAEATPEAAAPPKPSFVDAKKLVDSVFTTTISQAGEEVGALLGQTLKCDDIQLLMTTKADFFSTHCIEKSILTHMKVTGDKEGLGFMAVQVPDAVIMGGTLIMLPEDVIEEQKNEGTFDGEIADSFGEIANILAGSLTQVFLDRYPQQIRFIKTDTETVVPTKIDPASDSPFAEGSYYLVSFAVAMDGHELDRIQFIFPAEVFDLETEETDSPAQAPESAAGTAQSTSATGTEGSATPADGPAPGEWGGPPLQQDETGSGQAVQGGVAAAQNGQSQPIQGAVGDAETPPGPPVILVMSDREENAASYTELLTNAGYECRTLAFQDEVRGLFQQHQILGIFLVMSQVSEKGFAAAIKLQGAGRPLPPVIFAGPEWTKSAVLKAVKYGAKDILVTPASNDEIQDKISLHIKKAS